MNFGVTVAGLAASKKIISKINTTIDDETLALLLKLGNDIKADAKSNIQNNQNINGGDLLASVDIKDIGDNYVTVGSDLGYAGIIEYGRGEVRGKDKPLTWIDKTTGKRVFSWKSKAVEPSPFLEPAVLANTDNFEDIYVQKMTTIIESEKSDTPEAL